MESDITHEYIDALSQVIPNIFSIPRDPISNYNTNNIDFVHNENDLKEVIQFIRKPISGTKFFNPVSDTK
ncbi:MAG: hypothetical protein CM15mP64_5800 [Candidatus Neomarinimicrobiota bacterium]|nr:MAG: hypothetical protein CM15mP64_5800 [Candidatus Neomarinimicrobiota bacterium]